MKRFQKFDGSGRTPRAVQSQALEWLDEGFDECPVHVISGPVGCGKSAIAAALQLELKAHVIIPSNILMDQYTHEYHDTNFLKGKTHYQCRWGVSCSEWCDLYEQPACTPCPYSEARAAARSGMPTFFNPMSLYYLFQHTPSLSPFCMVVDEAHQLSQMVLQLCSKRFAKSRYGFTDRCLNEMYLVEWMDAQIKKLQKLANLYQNASEGKKPEFKKIAECMTEIEAIGMTRSGLLENTQNYAVWFEKGTTRGRPDTFLNVRAVRPPRFVMQRLLNAQKLVLMSGTLFRTDIEDLAAGRIHRSIDLPSPIPKANRPILYRPVPYPMNVKTDPARVVASIEKVLDEFPDRNAIVHTTYDRARRFAPFFKRPVLVNTPETKSDVLERFRREGGVFLASGCSEGLDLRDDQCRLNIIPHLNRPNLGDPVVSKRRALEDGQRWYALETLKTTIQQYGRSTRHERDHSVTVIMDPTFSMTYKQVSNDLPQYFKESIRWGGV